MKRVYWIFVLVFLLFPLPFLAQDYPQVLLNNKKPFEGVLRGKSSATDLQIYILQVKKKNLSTYLITGYSLVEQTKRDFVGEVSFSPAKGNGKLKTQYGQFELKEKGEDEHSGSFKGRLIFTYHKEKNSQSIKNPFLQFVGRWTSSSGKLQFTTQFKN